MLLEAISPARHVMHAIFDVRNVLYLASVAARLSTRCVDRSSKLVWPVRASARAADCRFVVIMQKHE
jgi:hypothetical protein